MRNTTNERRYCVALLPEMEIVERGYTKREAEAWIQTYHEVTGEVSVRAVIVSDDLLHPGGGNKFAKSL